ncbi:MAG: P-type conjugative transfer protein TrbJ [Hirschia sp.]|nr:P-type conjugative transfer protein TrbJ [Hirschia sp.]MBF16905.1 P-type conjugative transfer protein TrbJ [Hirschia sp.]
MPGLSRRTLLLSVVLAPVVLTPPALAQFVVIDPANLIQSILSLVESVVQTAQQVEQIANEIAMLENMARNLEAMPDSIASDIAARLARIDQLMQQAQGAAYKIADLERMFSDIYPDGYGDAPPASQDMYEAAQQRWTQARAGYLDALKLQAGVVENLSADAGRLNRLVGQSQSAAGNLEVSQAGNQIEALAAQQLIQIEGLLASHYRAEALKRSADLAEEARGKARLQRFLGD